MLEKNIVFIHVDHTYTYPKCCSVVTLVIKLFYKNGDFFMCIYVNISIFDVFELVMCDN